MGIGPGDPHPEPMETDKSGENNTSAPPPPGKKYYIDSTFLYQPREGVEFMSPMKDGLSECSPCVLVAVVSVMTQSTTGTSIRSSWTICLLDM